MKLIDYLNENDLTCKAFAKKVTKKAGKKVHPQAINKYANFESYPRQKRAAHMVAATGGLVTLADIYAPKPRTGASS